VWEMSGHAPLHKKKSEIGGEKDYSAMLVWGGFMGKGVGGAWCGLPSDPLCVPVQAAWHGTIDFFGARVMSKNKTMTANK
jgi:hypothetical protein